MINLIIVGILSLLSAAATIFVFVLAVKALLKYLRSPGPATAQAKQVSQSLGEAIRAHRARLGISQETLAERLGVSRQAVSKWESGASDPSTANLMALAKLFGLSVDELLRDTEAGNS